jgi:hypothetical protein
VTGAVLPHIVSHDGIPWRARFGQVVASKELTGSGFVSVRLRTASYNVALDGHRELLDFIAIWVTHIPLRRSIQTHQAERLHLPASLLGSLANGALTKRFA